SLSKSHRSRDDVADPARGRTHWAGHLPRRPALHRPRGAARAHRARADRQWLRPRRPRYPPPSAQRSEQLRPRREGRCRHPRVARSLPGRPRRSRLFLAVLGVAAVIWSRVTYAVFAYLPLLLALG